MYYTSELCYADGMRNKQLRGWKLFIVGLVVAVISSQAGKFLESQGSMLAVFFNMLDLVGLVMMLGAAEGIYWLFRRFCRG